VAETLIPATPQGSTLEAGAIGLYLDIGNGRQTTTSGRKTAEIICAHADLIAQRSGVRLEVTGVCPRSGLKA
jgi:hypothetical protein